MQKNFTFSSVAATAQSEKSQTSARRLDLPSYEEPIVDAKTWMEKVPSFWAKVAQSMKEHRGDDVRKLTRTAGYKIEEISGVSRSKLHSPTEASKKARATLGGTLSFLGNWFSKDLKGFCSYGAAAIMSELRGHPFTANFQNAMDTGRNGMSFSSGKSNVGDKLLDLSLASRLGAGPIR